MERARGRLIHSAYPFKVWRSSISSWTTTAPWPGRRAAPGLVEACASWRRGAGARAHGGHPGQCGERLAGLPVTVCVVGASEDHAKLAYIMDWGRACACVGTAPRRLMFERAAWPCPCRPEGLAPKALEEATCGGGRATRLDLFRNPLRLMPDCGAEGPAEVEKGGPRGESRAARIVASAVREKAQEPVLHLGHVPIAARPVMLMTTCREGQQTMGRMTAGYRGQGRGEQERNAAWPLAWPRWGCSCRCCGHGQHQLFLAHGSAAARSLLGPGDVTVATKTLCDHREQAVGHVVGRH
jgi:hypothetical protein